MYHSDSEWPENRINNTILHKSVETFQLLGELTLSELFILLVHFSISMANCIFILSKLSHDYGNVSGGS